MVKRKRNDPGLDANLQKWEKELVRAIKLAKGFERQRYAKRQRDADADKSARLEKEIAVLKSIDLHQVAHQHLCSSLLKIKGVAEAPRLPETVKLLPKPSLSEDERTALHNVTSALCNRKQVKDVIDEAVVGTCMALKVPMPEKKGKGKGKNSARQDQEDQADDVQKKKNTPAKDEDEEEKKEKKPAQKSKARPDAAEESDSWEGFGPDADADDSDAEEKAFARFDDMLGSSSEDEGGRSDDDENDEDSRARSIRGPSDYFSGSEEEGEEDMEVDDIIEDEEEDSSEEEEDEDEAEGSDSSASAISPPPKKVKSKPAPASNGNSQFLPSLMGGYISGSESEASDLDIAPPSKKNRRGQRARQAIWEKKFKKEANHVKRQAEMDSRDEGWDMKKGAVGEDAGPWKKGISNPFEKKAAQEGVHPDRQANFNARQEQQPQERRAPPKPQQQDRGFKGGRGDKPAGNNFRGDRPPTNFLRERHEKPAPKPKPKKDDDGPLHASWKAAKQAKEAAQNVKFEGKKITFD
ncbi:NADH-ubiquinone oxidoreductase 30.4 kDa subunit [Pestalotiopsis sp. NC0098]|nr:NADH-ubiquinone oxidoreductase 30.4 kDa subunit [Pestalotiopsis sp. NC0098]